MHALLLTLALAAQLDSGSSVFGADFLSSAPTVFAIGGGGVAPPTFDLNAADGSGPSLLSSALVIDGVTMDLLLDCDLRNVSGTNLTCGTGGVFAEGGTGSSPTSGKATTFTESAARSARGVASGKGYDAPSTSVAQIGTQDFAVEFVGQTSNGYSIASTISGTGWEISGQPAGVLGPRLNITDGGGTTLVSAAAATSLEQWQHAIVFADRSGSAQWYVNGVASAAATAISTRSGTLTTAVAARVLGRPATAGQTLQDGDLALVRVWVCPSATPNCFSTPLQAAVAAERNAKVWGSYADVAAGQAYPTTSTRAATAMVDIDRDGDGTRRLFSVGANAMRVARRNVGGTYRNMVLLEGQSTNLALQSETLATSWTTTQCAVTSNASAAPDQNTTMEALESTDAAGSVAHFIRQAVTLTAAGHTFSAWFKVGADTATHGWLRDNTVANAIGWIKLSDCTAGTTGAGLTRLVAESYGNSLCRLSITFTGTAAAHDFDIGYSNADNVTAYDDGTDSTADVYAWGAQVEAQVVPTSYIVTTTATVTRVQDLLAYAGAGNAYWSAFGTMEQSEACPAGLVLTNHRTIVGVVGTDSVSFTDLGGGSFGTDYTTAGTSQAKVGVINGTTDSSHHLYRALYGPNDVRFFADGVSNGTPDTTVTTWANGTATGIYVMNNGSTTAMFCGLTRFRLMQGLVAP